MFVLLRTSRPIAALTAFVLLTAAMAPLTPPCVTEAEAPCEEQMDHGTMAAHEAMPMAMDHAPSEAPAPPLPAPPISMAAMPCCAIAATAVAPVEVPEALVALAAIVLAPALNTSEDVAHDIAANESPPERSAPLYIAHGRFLI